jgi:hypothetical protein
MIVALGPIRVAELLTHIINASVVGNTLVAGGEPLCLN